MTILDNIIKDFEIEKEIEQKLRRIVNDENNINEIDFKLSLLMAINKKESYELNMNLK